MPGWPWHLWSLAATWTAAQYAAVLVGIALLQAGAIHGAAGRSRRPACTLAAISAAPISAPLVCGASKAHVDEDVEHAQYLALSSMRA